MVDLIRINWTPNKLNQFTRCAHNSRTSRPIGRARRTRGRLSIYAHRISVLEQKEGLNWIAHPLAPSRWEGGKLIGQSMLLPLPTGGD
jgi:hypothetical protein